MGELLRTMSETVQRRRSGGDQVSSRAGSTTRLADLGIPRDRASNLGSNES